MRPRSLLATNAQLTDRQRVDNEADCTTGGLKADADVRQAGDPPTTKLRTDEADRRRFLPDDLRSAFPLNASYRRNLAIHLAADAERQSTAALGPALNRCPDAPLPFTFP